MQTTPIVVCVGESPKKGGDVQAAPRRTVPWPNSMERGAAVVDVGTSSSPDRRPPVGAPLVGPWRVAADARQRSGGVGLGQIWSDSLTRGVPHPDSHGGVHGD